MCNIPDEVCSNTVLVDSSTTKIVLEILASGDSQEEFWYMNGLFRSLISCRADHKVPSKYSRMLEDKGVSLEGGGNFREIQILLDGQLWAVVLPFHVIFTGGIVPSLWR